MDSHLSSSSPPCNSSNSARSLGESPASPPPRSLLRSLRSMMMNRTMGTTSTPDGATTNHPNLLPPAVLFGDHVNGVPSVIFHRRDRGLTHMEALDAAIALVNGDDDYLAGSTRRTTRRNQGPPRQ